MCLLRNTEVEKQVAESCWVVLGDAVSCFALALQEWMVLEFWRHSAAESGGWQVHPVCAGRR